MSTVTKKGGRPKKELSPVTASNFATMKELVKKFHDGMIPDMVKQWAHPQGVAMDSSAKFNLAGIEYSFKTYLQPAQADEETLKEKLQNAQEDAAWEKLRGQIIGTFGMFAFSLLTGGKNGAPQYSGSFGDLQQKIPMVGVWAEGIWRMDEASLFDLGGDDSEGGHMFARFDRNTARWQKVIK